MHYHFPTILELTDLVESYNHRIYEKTPLHFDFLYYRLGLGKMPTSYDLKYGQQERSGKKDALEEEGYALYSRHKRSQICQSRQTSAMDQWVILDLEISS